MEKSIGEVNFSAEQVCDQGSSVGAIPLAGSHRNRPPLEFAALDFKQSYFSEAKISSGGMLHMAEVLLSLCHRVFQGLKFRVQMKRPPTVAVFPFVSAMPWGFAGRKSRPYKNADRQRSAAACCLWCREARLGTDFGKQSHFSKRPTVVREYQPAEPCTACCPLRRRGPHRRLRTFLSGRCRLGRSIAS